MLKLKELTYDTLKSLREELKMAKGLFKSCNKGKKAMIGVVAATILMVGFTLPPIGTTESEPFVLKSRVVSDNHKQLDIVREINKGNPENLQKISSSVEVSHSTMDNLLGYGEWKQYEDKTAQAWEPLHESLPTLAQEIEAAAELAEYEPLKMDLEAASGLLRYSLGDNDVHALIDTHRILHDLDYRVLNRKGNLGNGYWGVTTTLEGELKIKSSYKPNSSK